jgi:hypothetical protein
MGYNTTVFILNDRLPDIKSSPVRFVNGIVRNLLDGTDHTFGQTAVMPTAHADVPRLYFTHGNSIVELSKWAKRTMDMVGRGQYAKANIQEAIKTARKMLDELEAEIERDT